MNASKLTLAYSARIVRREWRRFVLSFLSLVVTAVVLMLTLLLTGAGAELLTEQSRALQGGDAVFESAFPISSEPLLREAGIVPVAVSEQIEFSGTLQSGERTAPFSVKVVDGAYPLYGEVVLAERAFSGIANGEILLDGAGMERLGARVGDVVMFGDVSLIVSGTVVQEPSSLVGGFRFLPTARMSTASFGASNIDPQLLRAEYRVAAKVPDLTDTQIDLLRAAGDRNQNIDVDIAGQDQRGLQFGLETVTDFLIIAVLVTAVLAAVNVYASTLYLITVERKSLAIFLALGITRERLTLILGAALGYIVILSCMLGTILGAGVFKGLQVFVAAEYLITLPEPSILLYGTITSVLIVLISSLSFLPAVRRSLALNPRQILIGGGLSTTQPRSYRSLALMTVSTLVPLLLLASFLLGSVAQGLVGIGAIIGVYVVVAILYMALVQLLYRARARMPFFVRTIVSQKYADGLFGVVSFTSLFVALTALSTLALIQVSLERFLTTDLGATVPTTYVLDVQPSQKAELTAAYPDLMLFSNVGARIIEIDGLRIQEELEAGNPDISGELGREFNLTARTELLDSETISAGDAAVGRPGEISVDADFAEQANIALGSTVTFLIQGFEVSGTVTSLRTTDSRSGLPFFYFVLSPDDIGMFPSVYFGYGYYEGELQAALGRFLADYMPNVTLIDTQSITPLIMQIVSTLMVLVLVVTIPPLLIATLLIAMLVVSSYATRRREGARFRALGVSRPRSFWQYVSETLSVTVAAALCAYGLGVLVAALVSTYFLKLERIVFFDGEVIVGLFLIVFFIFGIAVYLYKTDTMPLRELLSYE